MHTWPLRPQLAIFQADIPGTMLSPRMGRKTALAAVKKVETMSSDGKFVPPNDSHRVLFFGRTGSGKTVGGLAHLSGRSFDKMPWTIWDYKGDKMIAEIEARGAREIDMKKVPTKPGLYIVRPDPQEQHRANEYLLQSWRNEENGHFFDEGFMVPQHRPFKAFDHIMTQGRSRNVPVIACYQRPAWLSQFAMSQADYFACYHLLKPDDRARVAEYVGEAKGPNGELIGVNYRLPDHHFLWYDVSSDQAAVMRPVPPPDAILDVFERRLGKRRGFFV